MRILYILNIHLAGNSLNFNEKKQELKDVTNKTNTVLIIHRYDNEYLFTVVIKVSGQP